MIEVEVRPALTDNQLFVVECLIRDMLHPEPIAGLSRRPAAVLRALRAARGRPLSRDTLIAAIAACRSTDEMPCAKLVDVYICHLRAKGWKIKTHWGLGYELTGEPDAATASRSTPQSRATPQ